MRRTLTFAGIAALLAAAGAGQAAATDAQAAIEEQAAAFEEAFNTGNAEALAALYTEDAALFPPGAARIDGRSSVQEFWAGAMGSGLTDLDLQTVEVHGSGDMAVEVGTLTMTAPAAEGGGRTELGAKYIVVWQQGDDGTWRLHRDIWNMGN